MAARHGTHRRLLDGWVLFGMSVCVWTAVSVLVFHQPFHLGLRRLRFFDLHVYRDTALDLRAGRSIYDMPIYRHMQFTYPPFAALVMLPTTLVSFSVAAGASVVINLACLLAILRLTPRLGPRAETGAAGSGWGTVGLLAALLLWSEPVSTTLGYAQIDLIITLLVVWDLTRRPGPGAGAGAGSPVAGIGIGLAAGLKLTPLIFIPYLLLVRERRAGLTAAVTFLITVAIGFAFAHADSSRYWDGLFLHASRTGNVADAANQSLTGLITQLTGTRHLAPAWVAVDALVAILGVGLAARAGRRAETGVGFAVCALTSLLVSPVSWTHHWVLMIPAVWALWSWAGRRRARWVRAILAALVVVSYLYLPELLGEGAHVDLGTPGRLLARAYVLLGAGVLVAVATGVGARRAAYNPGG